MTEITYTCKFCKQPRVVEADLEGCPIADLEKWKRMLACNRCADFHRMRIDLIEGALRYAVALIRARRAMKPDKLREFESQISDRFTGITKKFADIVCRHYGTVCAWEVDFVEQLMRVPEKTEEAMNFYHRNIRLSQRVAA